MDDAAMRWSDGNIAPSHRPIASPHRPSHRLIVHRIASSSIASPHRLPLSNASWTGRSRMRTTTHEHARPRTTTLEHARPHTTTHDHARPRTTTHDHARPRTTTHVLSIRRLPLFGERLNTNFHSVIRLANRGDLGSCRSQLIYFACGFTCNLSLSNKLL